MWSLPEITRLNSEAAGSKRRLERAVQTGKLNGKKLQCEHQSDDCHGQLRHYLWYDIFSDNPKGVLTLSANITMATTDRLRKATSNAAIATG